MLRPATLIVLVGMLSTEATADRFKRANSRCSGGRSSRGLSCENLALIEFAPASGAGMTAPCACVNPTGARGEAMTVTRASSASCSKQGVATTGINNGDLVSCGNDLARVELSNGVAGIRTELTRTNQVLRSQEFDNAAWTSSVSGVAAPTITANAATAPDGTSTAERFEVPATTSGQFSYIFQGGFAAAQTTSSIYVRGVSGSGSINVLSGAGPNACLSCSYVSTSWTRCRLNTNGANSTFLFFGNDSASAVCGTGSKGAIDAYIWGAQHEEVGAAGGGGFATSYIATTSASVVRAVEAVSMAIPDYTFQTLCVAATVEPLWASTTEAINATGSSIGFSSPTASISFNVGGLPRMVVGAATAQTTFTSGAQRFRGYDNGTNTVVFYGANTASVAAPVAADRWNATFRLAAGAGTLNSIITQVQADPDPTRCQ